MSTTKLHATRDPLPKPADNAEVAPRFKRDLPELEQIVEPSAALLMASDPRHPRCDKIRALRTELLLRYAANDGAEVIALLSPGAGEGRSLLAAELAIAFAQTGRPTLLVDADLRRSQQHVLFGTSLQTGLSQAVQHEAIPQVRAVLGLPRMALLTAGTLADNPLEMLSSSTFAAMIESWRASYKFVVIDTPPIAQFADGLAVANLAGSVLALSRAQHTRTRDMQDMLRRLTASHARVLGAVINHF